MMKKLWVTLSVALHLEDHEMADNLSPESLGYKLCV